MLVAWDPALPVGDVGECDGWTQKPQGHSLGREGLLCAHSLLPEQLSHVWAPGGPAVTVSKGSSH